MDKTSPRRRFRWTFILWLAVPILLWWVLRSIPLTAIFAALKQLQLWQIATLLLLNIAVMLTFSGRWWFILRGMGHSVSYLRLAAYRLAAFGVSYFTPGPQFGGEPLQVYAVMHRHDVPGTTSAAAVALDKLLEMVVNFAFISAGVIITLQSPVLGGVLARQAIVAALLLLALPIGYLIATWRGWHPLSWLLRRLPARIRASKAYQRTLKSIAASEVQASTLIKQRPGSLVSALLISLLSWGGQMLEYWLSARFLGLRLDMLQLVTIMTVAYAAFLSPLPGGLGALEAGQVWVFEALHLNPAAGLGMTLIIRARDVLFGVAGLWLASMLLGNWRRVFKVSETT